MLNAGNAGAQLIGPTAVPTNVHSGRVSAPAGPTGDRLLTCAVVPGRVTRANTQVLAQRDLRRWESIRSGPWASLIDEWPIRGCGGLQVGDVRRCVGSTLVLDSHAGHEVPAIDDFSRAGDR